jgi:hypothetical protein
VSCTKNIDAPSQRTRPVADKQPESCNFGIQVFNKTRRASTQETYTQKKKPRGEPEITSNATILLDFDGQMVSNTIWNTSGDINATPANLKTIEIDKILQRVTEDFSPFDVAITTDEAIYNATNPFKRMRVIVTENWEWFGVVGGTAFNHSFTWGNNTPCFIFSTLLSYNEKFIAEAISHEVGHTLSLMHQALYDGSCNFLSEYNLGFGEGITGWAPIMGIGYYRNVTTWHKGPTIVGCKAIQDDVAIIADVLGLRPDDNAEMNRSEKFNTVAEGIINSKNDIDYYFLDIKKPTVVFVQPQCLENEEGANLNLKLNIYDKWGVFIKTIDTPSSLSASVTLDREKYYVGVQTEANENQSRYGMLGRYVLRTNE